MNMMNEEGRRVEWKTITDVQEDQGKGYILGFGKLCSFKYD